MCLLLIELVCVFDMFTLLYMTYWTQHVGVQERSIACCALGKVRLQTFPGGSDLARIVCV